MDQPSLVRNIGQRSLVSQAREAILESITSGRFENGRIPPEKDLAEMLGVSRTTVRSALQSLQDAGVIIRTRGRGTTVRSGAHPSTLALHRLVGFSALLRETGRTPSVETRWTVTSDVSVDVAEHLGLEDGESCYVFERTFRADGEPAIWILHFCPASFLQQDFEVDLDDEFLDWFDFNERYGKERIDHAVVKIRAATANAETAQKLDLERDASLLVLHETHYSKGNEPLGYSRISVNQEYVAFQVLRTH